MNIDKPRHRLMAAAGVGLLCAFLGLQWDGRIQDVAEKSTEQAVRPEVEAATKAIGKVTEEVVGALEERILSRFDRLRDELTVLNEILRAFGVGIVVTDEAGRGEIAGWYGAAGDIFKYSSEEAKGMSIENLMVPIERVGHRENFIQKMAAANGHKHDITCDQAQDKDGNAIPRLRLHLTIPQGSKRGLAFFYLLGEDQTLD